MNKKQLNDILTNYRTKSYSFIKFAVGRSDMPTNPNSYYKAKKVK